MEKSYPGYEEFLQTLDQIQLTDAELDKMAQYFNS